MTIELMCRSSGKEYRLRDEAAGRRGRCTQCGSLLEVPRSEWRARLPSEEATFHPSSPVAGPPRTVRMTDQFEELQRIADYRSVRKTLRPSGVGSIVFGVIAIGIGIAAMEENPINAILVLIGFCLVVEGVWILAAPTPGGMIVDGLALLALGAWNILIMIVNASAGGSRGPHFFAILGGWQIIWGFQSFARYHRFSNMPRRRPSKEHLGQLDEIVKNITSAKTESTPSLVEFQVQGWGQQFWKGKLCGNIAIFAQGSGEQIIFATRDRVYFAKTGKHLFGKMLKASFRIREHEMTGSISPESLYRYETWKHTDSSEP